MAPLDFAEAPFSVEPSDGSFLEDDDLVDIEVDEVDNPVEIEVDEVINNETIPFSESNNLDNLVMSLEQDRNQRNIAEPVEENFQLVPGLRLDDLSNGNEEAAARIRDLAAAGNLHARVLLDLHNHPGDRHDLDEEETTSFEHEVSHLVILYFILVFV